MLMFLGEFATFLAEHADLLTDIYNALENGVQKDDLKKAVRDAKVAASDAAVKQELGLPQV